MMMVLSRVDPYSWHGGASVRCDDKKRNLLVWVCLLPYYYTTENLS